MSPARALRVLFLCTGNSARSQMAEALLQQKAKGAFAVASAGTRPAREVNPLAVEILREYRIDWTGRRPKGIDHVIEERWDFVITVCDRARASCPIVPGQPVAAHWGLTDPADVTGTHEERLRAFRDAAVQLSRRIDLLLALPMDKLTRRDVGERLRAIGAPAEASAESQ
jgi:arsenate reductase